MAIARKLARHLLIFINLMCMVFAIILIIMGILVLLKVYQWEAVAHKSIPIIMILLGLCVFVFAFLGFCGSIINNNCLILIYSILMLTLLSVEILLLFYAFYDQDKLFKQIMMVFGLAEKLKENGDPDAMNIIEKVFHCCDGNSTCSITKPINNYRSKTRDIQECKEAVKSFYFSKSHIFKYILIAFISCKLIIFSLGCFVSGGTMADEIEFTSFLH